MKNGLSDSALKRVAQYWEDEYDDHPGSQDVPTEQEVEYMRTDDTHALYDDEYSNEQKGKELQEDVENLIGYSVDAMAQELATKGYSDAAREGVWKRIMADPERFLEQVYSNIYLYQED